MSENRLNTALLKILVAFAFFVAMPGSDALSAPPDGKSSQPPGDAVTGVHTILPQFPYWVTARTLTSEKERIVLEGAVDVEVDRSATFHADRVIVHLAGGTMADVEFLGNVSMTGAGKEELTIKSQQAFSDNFPGYAIFSGNVVIRKGPLEIKAKKVKYNLLSGEMTQE
jgi:lipopolysaccharide assembly outer membrane protein LptD (OstA)